MSIRPAQGAMVSYQGHYAGSVSRFAAYSIWNHYSWISHEGR